MTDVFISYKHRMMPRVAEIAEALRALELDVWYDAGLVSGSDYADAISLQLRAAKCVLVCWTNDAFAHGGDKNGWVRGEAEKGRDRKALVAVMLEETDLDPPWNMVHYERLLDWTPGSSDRGVWQRVLKAIGTLTERPGLSEYDAALVAGTSVALSDWARRYPDDRLAAAAKTRAKALYLAEAEAKFEADDVAQSAAAEDAKARAKADAERRAAEERARAAQEAARLAAQAKAGREAAPQTAQQAAEPAARTEAQALATAPARGPIAAWDVLLYGVAGLLLCTIVFAVAVPAGWLETMTPGVAIAGAAVTLYGAVLGLLFWRADVLRGWRAFLLVAAFPLAAVAAGWLVGAFGQSIGLNDSSAAFAFGGGFVGAGLIFAVLFLLRAVPMTPIKLALAVGCMIACSAVTGAAAEYSGEDFGPEIFAWLTAAWQATFTAGLALMQLQPRRSASSM